MLNLKSNEFEMSEVSIKLMIIWGPSLTDFNKEMKTRDTIN